MSLDIARSGFKGTIKNLLGPDHLVERLYELGFVPGEALKVCSKLMWGEPVIVEVRGATIALRQAEAQCIHV